MKLLGILLECVAVVVVGSAVAGYLYLTGRRERAADILADVRDHLRDPEGDATAD